MTGIVEGIVLALGYSAGTASTAGAVAGYAAAAASVASAVATPVLAAKQQQKVGEANAAALEQEARNRAMEGSIAAERERRRNRIVIASQRAGAAEAGALSGSTLDLLDANSVALEMDALTIEYQGRLGAGQSRREADLTRMEARASGRGGLLAGIGGGLQQGSYYFGEFDPLNLEAG